MRFDSQKALEQLLGLAPAVDSMSLPTRMDLEARKIVPATALLPYDSLSSVALGLASGADSIDLAVAYKPPVEDPLGQIADQLDIGVVLGTFSTPYSMDAGAGDRTFNLKVGAAALDGHVLMPGELFSFNEVVGDRSAENGYRWAPGISGGQIIDVLGGGICQVASTIFGAGFFAGLDVVHARPHSRPSGYVDMGLDATVVWDSVDLVMRNPYDFPVVLHMTVSQGQVRAEVLGPTRPRQVAFERTLKESLPFETVQRADPRLQAGTSVVAQQGMRGFKIERVRKIYEGGEVVREDKWDLTYPATREIVRVGTNPAGVVPEKKQLPALRDPAASMRIMQ
ncbi:MAG: VanW family protein [Myxococcales bacterium]|nr:VanW family protein [Myxococcales bacterium]